MPSDSRAEAVIARYRPIAEEAVRRALARPLAGALAGLMGYHLGEGPAPDGTPPGSGGKRLRAVFCLLACEAVGGAVHRAAPAAAAVELIHGFTLLHDDVADEDELRRGRPTVWKLSGIGQAITAGDAMYALANVAALESAAEVAPADVVRIARALNEATLTVCEGQHLDISYEGRNDITVPDYLEMVRLKTGALFGAALAVGAIGGGGSASQVEALCAFGEHAGVAFQVRDDMLGIWGAGEEVGKPIGSDLRQNKRSLPVIYALSLHAPIAHRLAQALAHGVASEEAQALAAEMAAAGARRFCEEVAAEHLQQAFAALARAALPPQPAGELRLLAEYLLARER